MSYNKEYIEELKEALEYYSNLDTIKLSVKLFKIFYDKYKFSSNEYFGDTYHREGIYELNNFSKMLRSLIYKKIDYSNADNSFCIEFAYDIPNNLRYFMIRTTDHVLRCILHPNTSNFVSADNKFIKFVIDRLNKLENEFNTTDEVK